MIQKRLVVFGYSEVGHACLKFLLERGENILHVYTHADKPQEILWFPSIKKLAEEYNIPFSLDAPLKSEGEQMKIRKLDPDLLLSFYYRDLIPTPVLDLAPLGAYNMHGSLLPKYRGRSPVNWAVLKGEEKTGATLHEMIDKPDAGDIIDQEAVPIGPEDTSIQVQNRLTLAAVKVLARQIEALKLGKAPHRGQDHSSSTYFGGRRPEDGRINWAQPAQDIHNLIRAVTHPYPGAFTDIWGKKTYIWASHLPQRKDSNSSPGKTITDSGRLFVVCGDQWLLQVVRAQVEGQEEKEGINII